MGVTVITNRKDREANGVITAFDFDFLIYQDSDLLVYEVELDEDGFTVSAELKTLGGDYTVTLDPTVEGGTVNTLYVPEDGKIIRMVGNIPETQETDFPIGSGFSEVRIRTALDKLTRLVNQVKDRLNFAILRPISDGDNDVFTLTQLDAAVVSAEADKVAAETAKTDAVAAKVAAQAAQAVAEAVAVAFVPTGGWIPYGGTAAPTGWLLCDGSAVNRTTYAALFAVIADRFGAGNGTTTFNVPDMRERVPLGKGATHTTLGASVGAATVVLTKGNIPAHKHTQTSTGAAGTGSSGGDAGSGIETGDGTADGLKTSPDPVDILNPGVVCNYIIKT